jgi:hypothetical protein
MIWKDLGFEKSLGEEKLGPNEEVLDCFWLSVRKKRDVQGYDLLIVQLLVYESCCSEPELGLHTFAKKQVTWFSAGVPEIFQKSGQYVRTKISKFVPIRSGICKFSQIMFGWPNRGSGETYGTLCLKWQKTVSYQDP